MNWADGPFMAGTAGPTGHRRYAGMRTVPGDILYHKAFKLVQAGQWRYSSMRTAPGYVYTDVQTFKTVLLTVPELWFSIFRAWLYPMTGGTRTAALLHVPCCYPWKGGTRSAALKS